MGMFEMRHLFGRWQHGCVKTRTRTLPFARFILARQVFSDRMCRNTVMHEWVVNNDAIHHLLGLFGDPLNY